MLVLAGNEACYPSEVGFSIFFSKYLGCSRLLCANNWHRIHLVIDFWGLGYDHFLSHQTRCWKEHTLQDAELRLLAKASRGMGGSASKHRSQHKTESSFLLCGLGDAASPILCDWICRDVVDSPSLLPCFVQEIGCFCSHMFHLPLCHTQFLSLCAFPKVGSTWLHKVVPNEHSLCSRVCDMTYFLEACWCWRKLLLDFLVYTSTSLMKKYRYQGGIESVCCSLTASGNAWFKGSPQWCKQDNCENKCLLCNKKRDLILKLNTQKDVTHISGQLF